jgi:hypothetical protein
MHSPASNDDYQLLTSWLAVIGMLTMYWSPVERRIDQCVHALHLQIIFQKKPKKPTSLGRKLEFIKGNMPIEIIDAQELENLIQLTKNQPCKSETFAFTEYSIRTITIKSKSARLIAEANSTSLKISLSIAIVLSIRQALYLFYKSNGAQSP